MIVQNKKFRGLAILGAAMFLSAHPVSAQVSGTIASSDRTSERLDRLENQLRDLQGVIYSVEGQPQLVPVSSPNGTLATTAVNAAQDLSGPVDEASLSVRVTALEAALASLTGQVEEIAYKLDRQQRAIDSLMGTSGTAIGDTVGVPQIGGVVASEVPFDADATSGPTDLFSTEAPTAPTLPAVNLPDDPDAAYSVAYDALLSADYPQAESAFKAYVDKFPNSVQTPDAKFLLGEVYLATGANAQAAQVFLDHVGTYKTDARSPEAYLKLGIAFTRLDRPEQACQVLNSGEKKFSSLTDVMKRNYATAKGDAGC